jgi:hypothetical protein
LLEPAAVRPDIAGGQVVHRFGKHSRDPDCELAIVPVEMRAFLFFATRRQTKHLIDI